MKEISLFARMAKITKAKCAQCRIPFSCCSPEYCDMAIDYAKEIYSEDISSMKTAHERLPFMSESGCVLPPHFRPLCSLHVCSISANGIDKDAAFTKEYFSLREEIEQVLSKQV